MTVKITLEVPDQRAADLIGAVAEAVDCCITERKAQKNRVLWGGQHGVMITKAGPYRYVSFEVPSAKPPAFDLYRIDASEAGESWKRLLSGGPWSIVEQLVLRDSGMEEE